jgi:signal transduction histidine kinase
MSLRRDEGELSAEEVKIAQELARRVAMAIDNARLYQAREDVISVVSHDLRNPLNVIALATAILGRGQISDTQRKHLGKIERSMQRMNRLIEELLDITKLESNTLPISRTTVGVQSLIADTYDMMRPIAEEKGVSLERELGPETARLFADRERMLQVLSNLVGNAVKFTSPGGRVMLAAQHRAGLVRFSVEDTGPGIAADDLSRVFDRYWQGGRESRQGAGLGLAIAKGIVHAHGGEIGVDSVLGKGSTFWANIPELPLISA